MERSLCMYSLSRLDPSYRLEVRKFIDVARRHACRQKTKYIYCPCIKCKNVVVFEDAEEISSHFVRRGFMKDYLIWVKHGEGSSAPYAKANLVHLDGHDTIGPRLILLWRILVMMMSVSKMRVKTSTKFKSMKVNKQSFSRHCCTVIRILLCSLSKEWRP